MSAIIGHEKERKGQTRVKKYKISCILEKIDYTDYIELEKTKFKKSLAIIKIKYIRQTIIDH